MSLNIENFAQSYSRISVIGAGAWGTALAAMAAARGRNVRLWAREAEVVASIAGHNMNDLYLRGAVLPKSIQATSDLAAACDVDAILCAVPAQHLRTSLGQIETHLRAKTPIVLCAKGIETSSGSLVTEILSETIDDAEVAILSGPSFAKDAVRGLPTLVAIGARKEIAVRLQATLGENPNFRPYVTADVTGVALGGAAKNVYAIACGMVEGAKFGESARAGLLARSFAELLQLGAAMGAQSETLMGLSGLGDLVLTATSMSSRNFSLGAALGAGKKLEDLLAPGRPLAEGAATAPALVARGRRHGVELPIAEAVADVLAGKLDLHGAAESSPTSPTRSLSRPSRAR
nr:MAG: NAD(P)-dependent glycerol-3-phosphate dehydrogenase [Hyphomicrobiales bacterium]